MERRWNKAVQLNCLRIAICGATGGKKKKKDKLQITERSSQVEPPEPSARVLCPFSHTFHIYENKILSDRIRIFLYISSLLFGIRVWWCREGVGWCWLVVR